MKVQPTNNQNFNGIYKFTKATSYGRCIHGSSRGFDYDVYVDNDKRTGNVMYKLYYVSKNNKFVKSVLRFFSNNKVYKEFRSQAK
jgi:hypothetical protein